MRSTQLSLRDLSGCPRSLSHGLQEGTGQNRKYDIIWPALGAAGIPAVIEPSGLHRQDGKRPDGLTLIPWRGGRSLVLDVKESYVSPSAASYVDRAATDAGSVPDMAVTRKTEKYSPYRFEPIAAENLGVFSSTTQNFISELVRRICFLSSKV